MDWPNTVRDGVETIGAIAVIYAAAKFGLFNVQKQAIETLTEGLKTERDKRTELEKEFRTYKETTAKEIAQLRSEVARKEGVIEGKDQALRELVKAVAESGVCALAFSGECKNRVLPTTSREGVEG